MWLRSSTTAVARAAAPSSFALAPLRSFGAEITDVDLHAAASNGTLEGLANRLQAALDAHGLLLVRGQFRLTASTQIAVANLLGEIFPLPVRFQHAKSPHPNEILRISNSESEGFKNIGTAGWHSDGTSYACPFGVSIMHIVSTPHRSAPTLFLPLSPLANRIRDSRPDWSRLWLETNRRVGEPPVHHPLLYAHPRTRAPSVCLGKTYGLLWDGDGDALARRVAGADEVDATLTELHEHVTNFASAPGVVYRHEWRTGDLVLCDNLAVAHLAPPETQSPTEELGLRVLHRIVTAGVDPLVPLSDSTRPRQAAPRRANQQSLDG